MAMTLGGDGSATGLVITKTHLANQQITFGAYANVATACATSTGVKLALGFEEFDSHGYFDPTTSRFTPQVAGYYFFTGEMSLAMTVSTAGMTAGLGKNGTVVRWGNTQIAGNRSSVSAMLYLNGTTDYVELFVFHTNGSTINCGTGADTTYLSGFLVRAA
jgi:hypothetical protein